MRFFLFFLFIKLITSEEMLTLYSIQNINFNIIDLKLAHLYSKKKGLFFFHNNYNSLNDLFYIQYSGFFLPHNNFSSLEKRKLNEELEIEISDETFDKFKYFLKGINLFLQYESILSENESISFEEFYFNNIENLMEIINLLYMILKIMIF